MKSEHIAQSLHHLIRTPTKNSGAPLQPSPPRPTAHTSPWAKRSNQAHLSIRPYIIAPTPPFINHFPATTSFPRTTSISDPRIFCLCRVLPKPPHYLSLPRFFLNSNPFPLPWLPFVPNPPSSSSIPHPTHSFPFLSPPRSIRAIRLRAAPNIASI